MNCSVLIVEDDARFRDAFENAIRAAGDLQLLGCGVDYSSGRALLSLRPDVLLVDLALPDGDGVDLIREAVSDNPHCDIMVVSVFGDERNVLRSIEAGATGYLLKDMPPEELVRQIRVLRAGGSPINPVIARRLLNRLGPASAMAENVVAAAPEDPAAARTAGGEVLSAQEVRVLTLTAKGYSYDEVAGLLQISHHTVQTYVKRIYRKLQVNSKVSAVAEARRLRLIEDF